LIADASFCNGCGTAVRRAPRGVKYAGFWRRVLAVLIDLILLAPAIEFGKEYFYASLWHSGEFSTITTTDPASANELRESNLAMLESMAQFGTLLLFIAGPYFVLLESSPLKGTLGKRLLKMRVVDTNGAGIRSGRALLRFAARQASAVPWFFGFVMAAFTSKKQALHDLICGTLVVVGPNQASGPDEGAPLPGLCPRCSRALPPAASYCPWCGVAAAPPRYAGVARRLAALLVDLLILTPFFVFVLRLVNPVTMAEFQRLAQYNSDRVTTDERMALQTAIYVRGVWIWLLLYVVGGIYCVLAESSALEGTPGKRLFGLSVKDMNGRRISKGRALKRYLAHIVSAWIWMVGFAMAAFTTKRQALHDILVGTVVVADRKPNTELCGYGAAMRGGSV
jgi:uncharacterized RDD family membrane protein YckC